MSATPNIEVARFLEREPGLFVDNAWVPASGGSIAVVNPATEEKIGDIGLASAGDVDLAVGAARRAFDEGDWDTRYQYLVELGEQLPDMAEQERIEAPLVRIVEIKEPGGKSIPREVVKLGIQIGDRKLTGEFTLNNRSNMLAPVLIGRTLIQELGWVDPGRIHLAEKKIFR